MKTQEISRRSFLGQFLAGAALGLAGPQIVTHGLRLAAKVRPSGLSEVRYEVFSLMDDLLVWPDEWTLHFGTDRQVQAFLLKTSPWNKQLSSWKNL